MSKIKLLVANNANREILKLGNNHLMFHDGYIELVWNFKMIRKETGEEEMYYEKTGIPKNNNFMLSIFRLEDAEEEAKFAVYINGIQLDFASFDEANDCWLRIMEWKAS